MLEGRGKLYQDQLYGAKVLSPLAIAIMDSAEFQRLSGLRQLGFADVMYRGARHSRFEHSVGTYFLTRTIMRRIVQNHERLGLEHPGQNVSASFRSVPSNSDLAPRITTYQSRWRGLMEVVCNAALLHDLGHVPFGHTLEDEFAGLYKRHDNLAGPRLYSMLFDESSELKKVFSDELHDRWLEKISNETLGRLIYVILSWKEHIDSSSDFPTLLEKALATNTDDGALDRLNKLKEWHTEFVKEKMFHPFMSDIIGNTICADLLDYLPRDRMNLGMEPRRHTRLQRYFTIRKGTFYEGEGLRTSIMVTRRGRGGQKRDVATSVLDIMRERYEMAERVFYHHKKAAVSAMLAKLVELAPEAKKPRDDDAIYPAPWEADATDHIEVPHMTHLSDSGLIDYLGTLKLEEKNQRLQKKLYTAIRFRRNDLYRLLLVIDLDLVNESKHRIEYFVKDLRGPEDQPSSAGRLALETKLEAASSSTPGEVIVYCPSAKMQAKEIDARLEIVEEKVLPLRKQSQFVYKYDVNTLESFYKDLWRAYVFVSPGLFKDAARCKALVDAFCVHYEIVNKDIAYHKMRAHNPTPTEPSTAILRSIQTFVEGLPFQDVPAPITLALYESAADDEKLRGLFSVGLPINERLKTLLDASILNRAIKEDEPQTRFSRKQQATLHTHIKQLVAGNESARISTQDGDWKTFKSYEEYVLSSILAPLQTGSE